MHSDFWRALQATDNIVKLKIYYNWFAQYSAILYDVYDLWYN